MSKRHRQNQVRSQDNVRLRPPASQRLRCRLTKTRERLQQAFSAWRSSSAQRLPWRALLASGLALVVVVVLAFATRHALLHAEGFRLRRLHIAGCQRLSAAEVQRFAGLRLGSSMFRLDAAQLQRRLARHPWVESVRVWRRLPDAIGIRLIERRAIAQLILRSPLLPGDVPPLATAPLLVSQRGEAFKPFEAGDPAELPRLTGMDAQRFALDAVYRQATLQNVVHLLLAYRATNLGQREKLLEVHIADDESLEIFVGHQATAVRLGTPPFADKLQQLALVWQRLQAERTPAAYVYLDQPRLPMRAVIGLR